MTGPATEEWQVTRRFAARSQIETSIDLFLQHKDHLSAHVLAWVAVEMLRGVARARKVETFLEHLEGGIRPESLKDWRNILKSGYNFAKHADIDPDKVLNRFWPETIGWAIFAGILDYASIYGQRTWPMLIFQHWFLCRNPKITVEPMSIILPDIAGNFGDPAGKPLSVSTFEALEMIEQGSKHLDLVEQKLGQAWQGKLER